LGRSGVREWTLLRSTWRMRGALGGSGLTSWVKPQWVHYELEEAIEKSGSDILAHTRRCVEVFCWINGCLDTKDNRDSWGLWMTSAECRTIMTVVLMVMNGVDPHVIRVTWISTVAMLGWLVSLFF
jgi:hypothetical protein